LQGDGSAVLKILQNISDIPAGTKILFGSFPIIPAGTKNGPPPIFICLLWCEYFGLAAARAATRSTASQIFSRAASEYSGGGH
jgi:hypothetical protein